MRIRWTSSARRNLDEIVDYIALENPGAAMRMDLLLSRAPRILTRFPLMGKSGALQGTRELLPHPSYRMVYAVGVDEIAILAIVHTSRQWPPIDDEDA